MPKQDDYRCHMLLTKDLKPVPETIKTIENWGPLSIVVDGTKETIKGEHVFLEGDTDDFDAWWKGKKIWVGTSHPQLQCFEQETF